MGEFWDAREDGEKVDEVGKAVGEDPHGDDRRGGDAVESGGARAGRGAGPVVNAIVGALVLVLAAVGVGVYFLTRDDDSSFDAHEIFGDNGPRSIQDHSYEQLAYDSVGCVKGAEPQLAPLLDASGCGGIVRAVSVDAGHRFVASVAAVKARDEETADRLKADIDSGKTGTDRVPFLLPPPGSGAVYRSDPGNLTAVVTVDRHVLLIEVARFDGSAAVDLADEQLKTVARDLLFVPTDHFLAEILRDM